MYISLPLYFRTGRLLPVFFLLFFIICLRSICIYAANCIKSTSLSDLCVGNVYKNDNGLLTVHIYASIMRLYSLIFILFRV